MIEIYCKMPTVLDFARASPPIPPRIVLKHGELRLTLPFVTCRRYSKLKPGWL